ncbi:MAG: pitrilysin family protein [Acidobacteriota bacterium]
MRVEILANGLRLALKEDHSKNLIALCGYVNGGSRTEDNTIKGLSHYYEHIIFRGGTARQAELETRQAFQALGEYGGYTSDDATCYYFTVPKENFSEALWRYCDALMNLQVTAEKVEKDRQSIIQEYHMSVSDKPWGLAYHNLRHTAYHQHPYKVDPIGLEEVICHAQLETFRTFYQERYVPNQISLAVVGDFDSDEMLLMLESAFGTYQRGRDSFELNLKEDVEHGIREISEHIKTELSYFYLGFHLPAARSGDMAALSVLTRILGSARSARLEQALKQQELLVQDVAAFLEMRRDYSMFTIAADLKSENQRRTLEVITKELVRLINEPVPEGEVERAKRLVENSHNAHYESFQNRAQGLCWYTLMSDVYQMANWLPAIRAVSSEDIQRVAATYLSSQRATLSTVAPIGNKVEKFAQLFTEKLTHKREHTSAQIASVSYKDCELPCGIRLLLHPAPASGRFAALVVIGGGQLSEPYGEAGITNFVGQMLLRGTRAATREELARKIADLGLDISVSVASDYLQLLLSSAAMVWRDALRLFCEVLYQPAFSLDEIEKLRREVITDIGALADDSFACTDYQFNRALYNQHPYGNYIGGEIDTVEHFSSLRLRDYYTQLFQGKNILLAIAGEVEFEEVVDELDKLTVAWPSKPSSLLLTVDPPMRSSSGIHWIEKESQQVTFNWGRLTIPTSTPDSLALRLAITVLSYRLFYRQVYQEGLAYRMWTLLPMRREIAPCYFQMGVAPENFTRAREVISQEVARFLSEPIPSEEFARAQATLIQRFYLAQSTCTGQVGTLAHYRFYGFERDFIENYSAHIRAISKADVETAAHKFIRLDDMTLVVVGPARSDK